MEPMITISLKDYKNLKDLECQFDVLKNKIQIDKGVQYGPSVGPEAMPYTEACVKRKDVEYFIKILTYADKVYIKND